jgi:hypothetical protein
MTRYDFMSMRVRSIGPWRNLEWAGQAEKKKELDAAKQAHAMLATKDAHLTDLRKSW